MALLFHYNHLSMKQLILILSTLLVSNNIYAQFEENYELLKPKHPVTTVSFDFDKINFGTIEEGEQVKVVYTIFNTGDEPLMIYSVKASCGCTVPEHPLEPIMPQKSGLITAIFDSKGRVGENSKRITVNANTEPINTIVILEGIVEQNKKTYKLQTAEKVKPVIPDDLVEFIPNPVDNILTIIYKEDVVRKFKIYNMEGQEVLHGTLSEKINTIDVSQLRNNTYTFQLQYNDNAIFARQFIVIR